MPRPKIPVEDRLEIMELFAYYAWGLNTGDAEEVLACFAGDAVFEHQPQGIFRGHDQLRVLLDQAVKAYTKWASARSRCRRRTAAWSTCPACGRCGR
jgi:SnoaL-like domain